MSLSCLYQCVSFDRQRVGSLLDQPQTTHCWSTHLQDQSYQSLWLGFMNHHPWGWMDQCKDVGRIRNHAWKIFSLRHMNIWSRNIILKIQQPNHDIFPCYLSLNLPFSSLHLLIGECCSYQGVVPSCKWFSSCMHSLDAKICENNCIFSSLDSSSLCPC